MKKIGSLLFVLSMLAMSSCGKGLPTSSGVTASGGGTGGGGGIPAATQITLFSQLHDGNLKGAAASARAGANAICQATYTANYSGSFSCSTFLGLVSISASDQIIDMGTNYNIPSNLAIKGPTGLDVAANWNALLTDPLSDSMLNAGVVAPAGGAADFWTGSADNFSGSFQNPSCLGFTDGTGGNSGMVGSGQTASTMWWTYDDNTYSRPCNENTMTSLLCACW